MSKFIAQLTGFDYEDDPEKEYLRITFNIAKGDLPDLLKSRIIKLGEYFEIDDMTSNKG